MRRVLLLGLLMGVQAAGAFEANYGPRLEVPRTAGHIKIDGDLNDAGWQGAARATGFCETSPGDQIEPPVQSEAWVAYDEQNFYVALIAFDDPSTVRATLRERDNIWRDDYFGIMFDPYDSQAWAYEFFVNPLGIQGDLRMMGGGNEDIGFDVVWDSHGRVTDTGYQVEIAIPFASLRFPDTEVQNWRFNFWRDHQREVRRRYCWAATDRDDPCWMCQWGILTGIRGVKPSSNIDLIASAVGYQASALEDAGDPHSDLHHGDPEARFSFNARYSLSSSSSAEVSVNPDFSQIESDAGQIDVNSTFALFYPERRPFFQEGSDLYNTYINAVYTRSINDPDAAAKFTGTFGETSVLYLFARDANTPVLLPAGERTYLPLLDAGADEMKSISNIARVRRTYGENSHVGLLATDRRLDEGGSGATISMDGRHRFGQHLQFEYQFAGSHTEEPNDTLLTPGLVDAPIARSGHTFGFDGESFWGHALYTSFERNGRVWNADIDYWEYSPTFRSDNGFTTRNNYRQVHVSNDWGFNPNGRLIQSWGPHLNAGRAWTHHGEFKEDWVSVHGFVQGVGQTGVSIAGNLTRERFQGREFDSLVYGEFEVNTQPSEYFSLGGALSGGRSIYRTSDDPRYANSTSVVIWGSLKVFDRLLIGPSARYYHLEERHGGAEIFDGYIARARLSLQATRRLSTRLILQYDDFSDRFDIEPLVTYRINPFTIFYAGATGRMFKYPAGWEYGDESSPQVLGEDRWELTDRQFFAKFQYLMRI